MYIIMSVIFSKSSGRRYRSVNAGTISGIVKKRIRNFIFIEIRNEMSEIRWVLTKQGGLIETVIMLPSVSLVICLKVGCNQVFQHNLEKTKQQKLPPKNIFRKESGNTNYLLFWRNRKVCIGHKQVVSEYITCLLKCQTGLKN